MKRVYDVFHPKVSYLALGLIGVGDTIYLLANKLAGRSDICLIGQGCNTVLGSNYAEFLGIGLPIWGLLYYLIFFIGILFYYGTRNDNIIKILALLSIVGLILSLYFVYLQVFVIKAICEFCMLSALNSTLLFIISMVWLSRSKKVRSKSEEPLTSSQMTTEYAHGE